MTCRYFSRRVDILVNTVAILHFAPFEDLDMADYDATINVNIKGYFLMTQGFGCITIEQKYGNIVHISSIAPHFPERYSGAYTMTKAAVNMLSKQVAA
ncbi:SDR family oxidoreductase [Gemella sp. zg-1178]|nr:SDR family oxidoreductase [Gemella sp. zg-1178]